MTLKRTALFDTHLSLGARLTDFGGWEMPLQYPSGTVQEHQACRQSAAIFDVSHLGTVLIEGPKAFHQLQGSLTNNLSKIASGRAQYTHLLDSSDASVLDDLIVWWVDNELFHVMPNASNTSNVLQAVGGVDITSTRSILALQGPKAMEWASEVAPVVSEMKRFRVVPFEYHGETCLVSTTGYTGEAGVEFFLPNRLATEIFVRLIALGAQPAGLGARDTLRLEAGLPLHGHELGRDITPLEARLNWVVDFTKGDFQGRDALLQREASGLRYLLHGIRSSTRQPLREGMSVVDTQGARIGRVSSGNFSPVLGVGIGFAFLDSAMAPGEPVVVEARGRSINAEISPVPFL